MKLAIGADHAGYDMKEFLEEYLRNAGHEVKDFGTHNSESVDYPDYVHPLATAIEKGEFDAGILLCGSANGVAMAANKHGGVRAAICWNSEITELARMHNDANIMCLPARFIADEFAEELVDIFLNTQFEGGRHQRRVNKISL